MTFNLSVIICTHNSRHDYLRRALDALGRQTLPLNQWELLLVDNTSRENLAERFDLFWHPNAHHVREENLGLTCARLRGIAESSADLLEFCIPPQKRGVFGGQFPQNQVSWTRRAVHRYFAWSQTSSRVAVDNSACTVLTRQAV